MEFVSFVGGVVAGPDPAGAGGVRVGLVLDHALLEGFLSLEDPSAGPAVDDHADPFVVRIAEGIYGELCPLAVVFDHRRGADEMVSGADDHILDTEPDSLAEHQRVAGL